MRATATTRYFLSVLVISVVAVRCQLGVKVVTTTFGVVRGQTIAAPANNLPPVTQYLGIPYGVQPSGEDRFNMAISAAKWTNMPKDAVSLSKVCIQSGMPNVASRGAALEHMSTQRFGQIKRLQEHLSPASEDCLYMNLFVPEYLETRQKQALPVLVLIHGDEYGWNAGNPYNATVLASYGQMIVVTLNYRLGVFGFLGRCETNSCMGNAGMSDIIAALKMLSNTLPAFGGDPTMVTLLGWGSGAALVSLLMTSPMTQPSDRRLFKRAILLDGSALSPWAMVENPSPFFYMLAEKLQCPINKEVKEGRPELIGSDIILRCMQDHSADNITKAARDINVPTFLSTFAPVIDGQMVPNKPKLSFGPEFGSLFRDIDLLVGMVSKPAHHLLADKDLTNGVEVAKRNQIFRTLVRNLFDFHRKEILDAIVNEYTDWENPHDHPKTIRNGVVEALSDALYSAPLIQTARLHADNDRNKQSNTFVFLFDHETRSWDRGDSTTRIRGSITGEHIPYILGYPLWNKRDDVDIPFPSQFGSEDTAMSRVMMRYVSNFVKSGDPSKPVPLSSDTQIEERFQQLVWTQFNEANREPYLEMSDRPRVKNYYRNAHVAFWNGFLPQLHAAGSENGVPDQHQFLPDHFKKESFFGDVRPYGGYGNFPFPPPPLPPTPLPKEALKPQSSVIPTTIGDKSTPETVPAANSQYSTILSVTVAVGCALLVLNICIFAGIYHQRDKQKRSKKKLQLQYHSYAAGDPGFSMNSPIAHQVSMMPPPPPPPGLMGGGGLQSQMEMEPQTMRSFNHQHHHMAHIQPGSSNSMPRGGFAEQEPLLATSSGTMPRPGVSPTCPRHGRAAMAVASTRGASLNGTLEEIQV